MFVLISYIPTCSGRWSYSGYNSGKFHPYPANGLRKNNAGTIVALAERK